MSLFLINQFDSEWVRLEDVIEHWPQLLDELSQSVGDDESQRKRLHAISLLISSRIAFADTLKSIVDFKGKKDGVEYLLDHSSRSQIDQLKNLFSEFETVELRKLNVMLADEMQNNKLTWRLLVLNLFMHVGLITGVFFLIFRNNQRMNSVMHQITELNNDLERKVEERTTLLSKNEERFRSLFENLAEGCQLIDRDWRYLFLNDVAEIHNRCSKESLIGKVYMDMWPGVESTAIFSKLKVCMEERIPQKSINEFVFPDGYKGFFDIRIQPFSEGIIILSTDITRRVHTEELEKLTTEVLSHINLISETEVLIPRIIETIKSRTTCEVVAVRIKESFDLTSMKSFGVEYQYEGNQQKESTADCKLLEHGQRGLSPDCLCRSLMSQEVEFTKPYFTQEGSFWTLSSSELRAQDGGFLTLEHIRCYAIKYETIVIIPLKSGDQIIGLLQLLDSRKNVFSYDDVLFFEGLCSSIGIALMRNVTEKELLVLNENLENRVIERTNKLLESNQELESFAYSVSHDLRAPLRHVIGFSDKLEKYLAENTDAEVKRLVAKISGSASKMGNLIDELLTYSRLGKTSLNLQQISLNAIIDDVIDEAVYSTENRKIEWRIMRLPDVVADRTGMRLIFQNLISNALKFSGKKDVALIEIGYQDKSAEDFLFFIRDNGVGFNMEYSANLFGVFQRLHSQAEFEGTGIGLASVRRIISRHGGLVWADAKENEGATFYFTLPKHLELN
jgi:signal transduction histidine kinase/PAS domain-containing protein